jgi:2,4-dienoyl-CoA reductase-like NADH-dependent reductase (Old Yellow Enzyme family)
VTPGLPDAARDAAAPDVFAPARLGPVTLRNRTIKSATFEGATPDGLVTDRLVEFHRAVAAGGVGMTTLAYCAVAPEGRTERRQIVMRRAAVPGLRRLTDAVHAEGAAVSAQLGHAGPVADARSNGLKALSPSRFFNPLGMAFTKVATEADVDRVVAAHADAAEVAAEAGFDAVELHFGHDYLISAFLSPKLNRRRDRFGGPIENRAEVARRAAVAVRERVGDRLAVLAKLTMHDGVGGGQRPADSLAAAKLLEADGALDALVLTGGSSLLNPMFLFRGDAPVREFAAGLGSMHGPVLRFGLRAFGGRFLHTYPFEETYLLPLAREFRAALSMPLVLLGGIASREALDRAMAEGFEFAAMARALLREPDFLARVRRERAATSACIHCNRCMPTIYAGTRCTEVTAQPWTASSTAQPLSASSGGAATV